MSNFDSFDQGSLTPTWIRCLQDEVMGRRANPVAKPALLATLVGRIAPACGAQDVSLDDALSKAYDAILGSSRNLKTPGRISQPLYQLSRQSAVSSDEQDTKLWTLTDNGQPSVVGRASAKTFEELRDAASHLTWNPDLVEALESQIARQLILEWLQDALEKDGTGPCRRLARAVAELSSFTDSEESVGDILSGSASVARPASSPPISGERPFAAEVEPTSGLNTARKWIAALLQRNECQQPDGRPLFAYRCTIAEFEQAREICCSVGDWRRVGRNAGPTAALFCIYAAEWWRRYHVGGAWRWQDILLSAGWDSTIPTPALYDVVESGLQHWRRKILQVGGGRGFLVTLACEGGLPLQLLQSQQAKLRRYFNALLREFRYAGLAGSEPQELAERVSNHLPKSLQQEVVFALAGDLIGKIWQFQTEIGSVADPIRALDRQKPDWRSRLPLELEDETATALLNNLVVDASRLINRQRAAFSMARQMQRVEDGWTLYGELRAPQRVEEEELRLQIPAVQDYLPERFELELDSAGANSGLFAQALRVGVGVDGSTRYLIEKIPNRGAVAGADVCEAIALLARRRGRPLGEVEVHGGGALGGTPWAFVPSATDSEVLEFIGEGSSRTRHAEVYVALPDEWTIRVEGDSSLESVGRINAPAREVWRAGGQIISESPLGDLVIITTAASEEESAEYRLHGPQEYWAKGGNPVYRGFPSLWAQPHEGLAHRVGSEDIEWKPRGSGADWRSTAQGCRGAVALRYATAGKLRYSTRVNVLPADARLEFQPDPNGRSGAIKLIGFENPEVAIEPGAAVRMDRERDSEQDHLTLKFEPTGRAPENIDIALRWPNGGAIELTLPFPYRYGRFVEPDGTSAPRTTTVSLDRAARMIASAVDVTPGARFHVAGTLVADDVLAKEAKRAGFEHLMTPRALGRHEVALRDLLPQIEQAFAITSDLDALIRLTIRGQAGAFSSRELHIARYEWSLERDESASQVHVTAEDMAVVTEAGFANVKVVAHPLWDPNAESIPLAACGTGRWEFIESQFAPGPWLITAWEGRWCKSRPLLWPVSGQGPEDATLDGADSIAEAVLIADPTERAARFDAVVTKLAENIDDEGWRSIHAYANSYRDFPKTAIDVFAALARNQRAAAMALMSANGDTFMAVWTSLAGLSFSWALVPPRIWIEAAARLVAPVSSLPSFRSLGRTILGEFFERAPAQQPHLADVCALIESKVLDDSVERDCTMSMADLEQAESDAIRSLVDERWEPGPTIKNYEYEFGPIPVSFRQLWRQQPQGVGFREPFLNAPVARAIAGALGAPVSRETLHEMRKLRDFEPDAFDRLHRIAYSLALEMIEQHLPELLRLEPSSE